MQEPSSTATTDREPTGRFAPGNRFGGASPYHQRIAKLREAMFAAVTPEDIKAIVEMLIERAKAGDTIAAREVLDRTLGKSQEAELMRRIEELEASLSQVWGARASHLTPPN